MRTGAPKENYLNKMKKCYCWKDDEKGCFNKNQCIECSLAYAKYTLETKNRIIAPTTISSSKEFIKQNKDIHQECYECKYFKAGYRNWADRCLKYDCFCKDGADVCNKY